MITDFEDFCIWVFVVVDDVWKPIAPFFKRPGPKPECGDSEYTDIDVLEDKGYISAEKAAELWQKNRILLRTIPRAN
jgi:hypothetical protein